MINSSESESFWQIDRFRLRDYPWRSPSCRGGENDLRGRGDWFIGSARAFVRYINSLTIGIVIAVIAFIYQYRREGASIKPVYLGEASYGTPCRVTCSRSSYLKRSHFWRPFHRDQRYVNSSAILVHEWSKGRSEMIRFVKYPRVQSMWPLRVSWFHVFARFEISNLSRQAGIIFINLRLCNSLALGRGCFQKERSFRNKKFNVIVSKRGK